MIEKRQRKSLEGMGPREVIKRCGKDASFPSGSASITNCQELGECISKKSLISFWSMLLFTKCLLLLSFGEKMLLWRILV